jgi:serine/threonine protein kinase/WD40 repeat protein
MSDKSLSTVPDDRFESVLAGILLAEETGEPIDLSAVVREYPELESRLREYFRDRDGFDRLAPNLAATASQLTAQAVPLDLVPGSHFAGYEIVRELGRGGMGIVYLANQQSPKRPVALKLIRMDRLAHLSPRQRKEWLSRFRTESQAAARIDDERVVTVYEVSASEGRPYYSMRYVPGRSLAAVIEAGPLSNRPAAILMEQVARAVQAIHDQGVLHRDLKPHNVIVDAHGRPHVTDFGLAKWSGSAESLTGTGEMLGSIHYVSPEQAQDASNVSEATDVYGLGATLYALLTGRPPFQGKTLAETLHQVKYREPVPPRSVNPAVDRDLNVIVLKCLEKEPRRRFGSAKDVANELKRYLDGRPIITRPIGPVGRMWRWSRRNRAVASLSAAAVVLISVAGAVYWKYRSTADSAVIASEEARNRDAANKQASEQAAYLEKMPLALKLFNSGELGKAREILSKWVPVEGETDYRGWEWFFLDAQCRETAFFKRGHDLQVQAVAWSPDAKHLASGDRQGMVKVWNLADDKELFQVQLQPGVIALAWSPDGKHLAAACPGMVKLLEADSGKESRFLRAVLDKNSFNAPPATGIEAATRQVLTKSWIASLAWSPNCHELAQVDSNGRVQLWDLTLDKNDPLMSSTHPGGVHSAAWSPDSSRLATVGGDAVIKVWDPTARKSQEFRLNVSPNDRMLLTQSYGLTWSDEKHLSVVFGKGEIQTLDTDSGKMTPAGRLVPRDMLARAGLMAAPAGRFIWAPGGKLLASVDPKGVPFGAISAADVKIWDAATGKEILSLPAAWSLSIPATLERGDYSGCCPAWDSNGRLLALGGDSGIVTARHVGAARRAVRIPIQNAFAGGFAWGSGNQHLWCASEYATEDVAVRDKEMRERMNAPKPGLGGGLPPPPPGASGLPLPAPKIGENQPAMPFPLGLPNLRPRPQIQLCDAITGEIVRKWEVKVKQDMLAESPDRNWLASATREGSLQLWRLTAEGKQAFSLEQPKGGKPGGESNYRVVPLGSLLAWSPDSTILAYSTARETTIRLWDPTSHKQVRLPLEGHGKPLRSLAWSPDSKRLASAGNDGTVKVWDVTTGKPTHTFSYPVKQEPTGGAFAKTVVSAMLAWNHDGTQLAVAGEDEKIHIWDVGSTDGAKELKILPGHASNDGDNSHHVVCAVAWSPDGKRLAAPARTQPSSFGIQPVGRKCLHCDRSLRGHS